MSKLLLRLYDKLNFIPCSRCGCCETVIANQVLLDSYGRARLEAWCKANEFHDGRPENFWALDFNDQEKRKPPEDPQFQADYTGTRYYVEEIPLRVE